MHKQSKIWGTSTQIISNAFLEVHRAEIKQGGVCSEHIHTTKINAFIVESGKLLIRQFKDNGLIDETILNAGDFIEIQPNEKHQFEGLDFSVVYEVYYNRELDKNDIIRFTQGFMRDDSTSNS